MSRLPAVLITLVFTAGVLPPAHAEVQPVTPVAAATIDEVELTVAGYREFVRTFSRAHLPFAQRFVEFDHRRVAIPQRRSRVFVWHFTTMYYDRDGWTLEPRGRTSPRSFVRYVAGRGDSIGDRRCCGVNWFMGRRGRVHKLAALDAKLRHNPPYDPINTGVEIEARSQDHITTHQYEQLAYLTMYVLNKQGLLRDKPLRRIARGHGEMRDRYLERHPKSTLGERDDFDAPVSRLLRRKINAFLAAHPNVPKRR